MVRKSKADIKQDKFNKYLNIGLGIIGIMLLIIFSIIAISFSNSRNYLNGMYRINGTEGICNEMNRTYKDDRCYLVEIDNFDENNSIINVDCSWGNYSIEIDTDYKITNENFKIDFSHKLSYYFKLKPLLLFIGCKI